MADQAENLRRLARARLAWREMAGQAVEIQEPNRREAKRDGRIIRIFSMARLKPVGWVAR